MFLFWSVDPDVKTKDKDFLMYMMNTHCTVHRLYPTSLLLSLLIKPERMSHSKTTGAVVPLVGSEVFWESV